MKTYRILGLAVAGLLAAGCASAEHRLADLPVAAPAAYHLGPGDQVRVAVFGLDAMANTYTVDDGGAIALPMLAPVPVAGKTVREAETAVRNGILSRRLVLDPQVSLQVTAYRPFYISGEVQHPGQYAYVPGLSLRMAVAIAGGYTFRARTKDATVTRATTQARAEANTPILPGDMILVRESWF